MKNSPSFYRLISLFLAVFIYACSGTVFSQNADEQSESEFVIKAYKLLQSEEVALDGKLDDDIWNRISPTTNFRQKDPVEGGTPSEKTEIFIAYDDKYLYIAANLFDSNPEGILAYQKRRNQSLRSDDRFMWILDTFDDGRNAYFFETNPAALRGDGLINFGQGVNLNKSWDGIWDARTTVHESGWSVEIRIPFQTLDFNPQNLNWGINFQRSVRRKTEEIIWSGWRRNQNLFRPQDAGLLIGLDGLSQGIGLEIKPFASTNPTRTWPRDSDTTEDEIDFESGLDVSYSVTPSLRTSLTVNTDFAEAEVDQRRVNLTRFPLVFPERRDFFLEGSNLFDFAPRSGVTPFFSRRIGLVDGDQIPLRTGLRVIGREGNTNIGFYQIRTGGNSSDSEDFTVARVKQSFLSESSIGMIYTRRATLESELIPVRQTVGADLDLGTSSFLGDKNLQFLAFFVWHDENIVGDESGFWDRTSRGIRLSYPNYPFSGSVSYREFGDDFDPATGITTRNGFRRLQPSLEYERTLSNSSLLRSYEVDLRIEYLTDLDFEPETAGIRFSPLDLVFESGERFSASISREFEQIFESFDILRDGSIIIPAGKYYTWSFDSELETASFRPVSVEFEYTYEGFWNGTRNVYSSELIMRPFPGINLSGDWIRSDVNLSEGNFSTDLVRFRSNVDLTPDLSITSILQFDNISDVMGLFNRLRWIIRPGADLFLVHTWNWIRQDSRFTPLETQGALKLSYSIRF